VRPRQGSCARGGRASQRVGDESSDFGRVIDERGFKCTCDERMDLITETRTGGEDSPKHISLR